MAGGALDVYALARVEVGQVLFRFVPFRVLLFPDFFFSLSAGSGAFDVEFRFPGQDREGRAHPASEEHLEGGLSAVVGGVFPLQEVVFERFPMTLVFLEETFDLFDARFCESIRLRVVGAAGLWYGYFTARQEGGGLLGHEVCPVIDVYLAGIPVGVEEFSHGLYDVGGRGVV